MTDSMVNILLISILQPLSISEISWSPILASLTSQGVHPIQPRIITDNTINISKRPSETTQTTDKPSMLHKNQKTLNIIYTASNISAKESNLNESITPRNEILQHTHAKNKIKTDIKKKKKALPTPHAQEKSLFFFHPCHTQGEAAIIGAQL